MRLGMLAALVFIVVSFSLMNGAVDNQSLLSRQGGATDVGGGTLIQDDLNRMMAASKTIQEGSLGDSVFTAMSAPFVYFDSIVSMAWKTFSHNVFSSSSVEGTWWVLVPYFVISPFIVVLFFGLIIIAFSILRSTLS